uniref:NAC domain-containing protein n=1 Tax=Nelumbo nucifera TaxID=4432 RepID=A0A822ZCU4_NELNU|nr:TPA_asm: hypothetical protein HUJ06_015642 [Nelumbo nucifera]
MADPNYFKWIPTQLPPGFRFHFHPTEEQLLCYYLNNKNNQDIDNYRNLSVPCTSITDVSLLGFSVIQEIDLYKYDPYDLPGIACFPFGIRGCKKHWYCFTEKAISERAKRKTRSGFWKRRGQARDIVGGKDGVLLGRRRAFVFYRGNSPRATKTDWIMYEYTPVDRLKVNKLGSGNFVFSLFLLFSSGGIV